jgi:hypothetical protein
MNKRHLLSGAVVALGLACGGVAGTATAAAILDDAVVVQSGGTTVVFNQATEAHEFFLSLQSIVTPAGFTDATVFLTAPSAESGEPPLFGLYSDGFTINDVNGHLNIYFISAGATADELNMFVTDTNQFVIPETGSFQDVSSHFGQSPGFAQILSDVAVPEPATWALMLLGFGGLGATLRMKRAARSFT